MPTPIVVYTIWSAFKVKVNRDTIKEYDVEPNAIKKMGQGRVMIGI